MIVETPYKAMVRKVNALISEGRAFTDGSYTIGEIPQDENAFISLADDFNYTRKSIYQEKLLIMKFLRVLATFMYTKLAIYKQTAY